jgi:hypothetical protein
MRHSEIPSSRLPAVLFCRSHAIAAAAALIAGCVVSLDDEFVGGGAAPDDAGADVTVAQAAGCEPLAGIPGVTAVSGDARSLALPDGGALWIVDQAVVDPAVLTGGAAGDAGSPDGGVGPSAACAGGTGTAADCSSWSARVVGPAFAPSPIAPGGLLVAQDLVWSGAAPALYYELFVPDPAAPLDLRSLGFGIAPRDPGSGLFVPTSELLWSPDRPGYGGSALRVGDTVYAYGCAASGYLNDACFVARADASQLTSSAAYTYWTGDHWSASPDDAAPVVAEAGGIVAVRPDGTDAGSAPRFVMTYVPTLGSTIVERSAIAPEGPWSAPTTLASCALEGAGPNAFCSGAQQHPELVTAPGQRLALTVAARTFATDAGATPAAFWPRLVTFPVP